MTTTNTEPGQLADPMQPVKDFGVKIADVRPVWHPADADPFAQFQQDDDGDIAPIENAAGQAEAARVIEEFKADAMAALIEAGANTAAYELRAMAAKFTESATSAIQPDEVEFIGQLVRHVYGKCAQELNQRADELAGGAR